MKKLLIITVIFFHVLYARINAQNISSFRYRATAGVYEDNLDYFQDTTRFEKISRDAGITIFGLDDGLAGDAFFIGITYPLKFGIPIIYAKYDVDTSDKYSFSDRDELYSFLDDYTQVIKEKDEQDHSKLLLGTGWSMNLLSFPIGIKYLLEIKNNRIETIEKYTMFDKSEPSVHRIEEDTRVTNLMSMGDFSQEFEIGVIIDTSIGLFKPKIEYQYMNKNGSFNENKVFLYTMDLNPTNRKFVSETIFKEEGINAGNSAISFNPEYMDAISSRIGGELKYEITSKIEFVGRYHNIYNSINNESGKYVTTIRNNKYSTNGSTITNLFNKSLTVDYQQEDDSSSEIYFGCRIFIISSEDLQFGIYPSYGLYISSKKYHIKNEERTNYQNDVNSDGDFTDIEDIDTSTTITGNDDYYEQTIKNNYITLPIGIEYQASSKLILRFGSSIKYSINSSAINTTEVNDFIYAEIKDNNTGTMTTVTNGTYADKDVQTSVTHRLYKNFYFGFRYDFTDKFYLDALTGTTHTDKLWISNFYLSATYKFGIFL